MSQKFEKLKSLLQELFQLDQPDLDFGLYRIMHARAGEITQFLERDLLPQVKQEFGQYKTADKADLEAELAKNIEAARGHGFDPESSQKVQDLRNRLKTEAVDINTLEAEVYDHLLHFFSRYYSEGDFISKRRYSRDGRYAIPYDGEEVKLYWANHDQFYVKTSEYLRDYSFRLNPSDDANPLRVHLQLVDAAEGEHGNVKAQAGKDRVFILSTHDFVTLEAGELRLRFQYRPATLTDWPEAARPGKTKPPTQKDLSEIAEKRVLALSEELLASWIERLGQPHTKADGTRADYSRLRAHLNRYVARNTFDYFIHKDLGGFLRRELDFYIKNEVMQLDDIESESAPRVEQYLSKIKVIRRVAGKIITFLAQLEDFQKTLWLKKKFVVETQYCVAIKEIPEDFLAEIVANAAQWAEWEQLHHLSELEQEDGGLFGQKLALRSPEFLNANPSLMIDTRHFDGNFTARLLEALGDIDDKTDGTLFHSENFQALNLMQARYRERVQCVLLDPPYNTGEDGFTYKDQFQHSAWMSMMLDRLVAANSLTTNSGIAFVHIDDNEVKRLWQLMDFSYGEANYVCSLVWKRRSASGMSAQPISLDHEYIVAFSKNKPSVQLHGLARNESDYPYFDQKLNLRYSSTDLTIGATREQRPNQFYPIANPRTGRTFDANPNRVWRFFPETMKEVIAKDLVIWPDEAEGNLERPRYKTYFDPSEGKSKSSSSWIETASTNDKEIEADESEYALELLVSAMNQEGGRIVEKLFGEKAFAYPKPLSLSRSVVRAATSGSDILLDFFAGSGTTGHAVMNLNREDRGRRRFILVEMADYFDTVLLPRLKKVAFTPDWKDGKPKRLATAEEAERGPRLFKIVRLESYEDTLNNLEVKRSSAQQSLLDHSEAKGPGKLREQYLLQYLLKVETSQSPSLLNVAAFSDPTAYRLLVKRPGSDESREVCVDLIETFHWLLGLTVQSISAPQGFSAEFEADTEKRLRLKGRLQHRSTGARSTEHGARSTEHGARSTEHGARSTERVRRRPPVWQRRRSGSAPSPARCPMVAKRSSSGAS